MVKKEEGVPSSLSNRFDFSFYESRFFVLFVDDHCPSKIEKPVFVPNPIYINTFSTRSK